MAFTGKKQRLLRILVVLGISLWLWTMSTRQAPAYAISGRWSQAAAEGKNAGILSPYWSPAVQAWSVQIAKVAQVNGIDPDLVAAVVNAESNGNPTGVSHVGAVGLMGVMPSGPGMEWRPSTDELKDPGLNVRWGVAIFTDILRQSGGDVFSALAAYNGGWAEANSGVPRRYAAEVLDHYGRAIMARIGQPHNIAKQWTIAVEMRRGYIPKDTLLVLGEQPVSGLFTYGEHILYNYVDNAGRPYYVRGYAVPVALVVPTTANGPDLGAVSAIRSTGSILEQSLHTQLGLASPKRTPRSPRVVLACLPSLSRLRGHLSTRWFAPSSCPSWHR